MRQSSEYFLIKMKKNYSKFIKKFFIKKTTKQPHKIFTQDKFYNASIYICTCVLATAEGIELLSFKVQRLTAELSIA